MKLLDAVRTTREYGRWMFLDTSLIKHPIIQQLKLYSIGLAFPAQEYSYPKGRCLTQSQYSFTNPLRTRQVHLALLPESTLYDQGPVSPLLVFRGAFVLRLQLFYRVCKGEWFRSVGQNKWIFL